LFHNANLFGSCIIHILYTECAKIKKNNSGAKGLTTVMYRNINRFLDVISYVTAACITERTARYGYGFREVKHVFQ